MTRFGEFSRRHFMTSVAAAAGSTLLPKALMAAPPQDPVVNTTQKDGKSVSREKVAWKVRPFPMKQVRLGDGPCKVAMEADRQYLHSLPPDRLLHTFRINAGIAFVCASRSGMGGARLRTPRPLRWRPLSFRLRPDVCQYRRRRPQEQRQHGRG